MTVEENPALSQDIRPVSGQRRKSVGGIVSVRWLVSWFVLYMLGFFAYNASYAFTRDVLIYHAQIKPAALLASLTLPGRPVWHDQVSIMTQGIRVEIKRGCDGMETWLLLATALVVFPMSWRRRVRAMIIGTLLVFTLNLLRIVSILHLVIVRPEWFDVTHGMIWQSVIILAVTVFVLRWMKQPVRPLIENVS